VLVFFSFSSGKRGVYVLPALPALALASGPYLLDLVQRRSVQRVVFILAAALSVVCLLGAIYVQVQPDKRLELISSYEIDVFGPLLLLGIAGALICALTRPARGFLAYAGLLAVTLLTVSYWVNPVMNNPRSGAAFIKRVEQIDDPTAELGFVGFKEQYLLNVHRPIVHFGHARWREPDNEAADAALWLNGSESRQLVVNDYTRKLCFADTTAKSLGMANRMAWFIVRGKPDPQCVSRGNASALYNYAPPPRALD